MCNVIVINGYLIDTTVASVIDSGGKTVIDRFDYPEARYLRLSLWSNYVPP